MNSSTERTPEAMSSRLLPPIMNVDGRPLSGENSGSVQFTAGVNHCNSNMWRRVSCFGGGASTSRGDETAEVHQFLHRNRNILKSFIVSTVPFEEVEGWYCGMTRNDDAQEQTNKRRYTKLRDRVLSKSPFVNLMHRLEGDLTEHTVVLELARSMAKSVGVDAYRLYRIDPEHPEFVAYYPKDAKKNSERKSSIHMERADPEQTLLLLDAAKNKTCMRVARHEEPVRFPTTPLALFRAFKVKHVKVANYILYQPILLATGKTGYVVEMWRVNNKFGDRDEIISSSYMTWGSVALHFSSLYLYKKQEGNMTDFLLTVMKAIFEEMVSLDHLIKKILEFAQKLVNADRASLFLVDNINNELVSNVFDLKIDSGSDVEKKEIRIPIHCGIAGYVATSGETMNIPDAYADSRFNRQVDEATGYKTVNILCMPIKVEGQVIGVVQMVNKRNNSNFTNDDETSFEVFSTFFGLALHNARLYDRIIRKEQKYRVALEVLSYHNTCKEDDVEALLSDGIDTTLNLNDFYLDPYQLDHFQKCKSVIIMFNDLFKISNFELPVLTRFVLTVKKNYRNVPYHNYDHGWAVAHAMYVILKHDYEEKFGYKRKLALFIASLCHDLDHRGYTNKYMSETASPLAAMYSTSTLEHHHFNITVTILQQEGHNIFGQFTNIEYREILGYIRSAILATDLAVYFPNLSTMKKLHDENSSEKFNSSLPAHMDLAMAIAMTAADLSASTKPWAVQLKTVKVIFEEFYGQGDQEKAAGKRPIPMMDRNRPEEQPASQVGFLTQICIPCYDMLYRILPHTLPMYEMAQENLNHWIEKSLRSKREFLEPIFEDSTSGEISSENLRTIGSEDDQAVKVVEEEVEVATLKRDPQKKTLCKKSFSIEKISWEEEDKPITITLTDTKVTSGDVWGNGEESGTSWIEEIIIHQEK